MNEPVVASAELVCEGDYWTIVYGGRDLRVRDSKGMSYLSVLLAHPGREIPALVLAAGGPADGSGAADAASAGLVSRADSDVGPLLDREAKSVYPGTTG